jgi:hypothetical protein
MTQQNGGGAIAAPHEIITPNGEHASSLDGFASATPEGSLEEHPELLVGAAFLAGVLLGGLVSRLGH